MTDPTDNHGYKVPSKGTQNWHEPLNDNFRSFETDIEIRDADANIGDYIPKDGAKFFATDTGSVYIGDGDSWTIVGTVSQEQIVDRQEARSFEENNLTLTHNGTFIENGSVGLVTSASIASRPPDNRTVGTGGEKDGLKIKPRVDLERLEVIFSEQTKDFSHAYVTETDGTIIKKKEVFIPDETVFSFSEPLESEKSYYVLIDDERDDSWTSGEYDPRPAPMDYPFKSGAVDITAGVDGGTSGLGETIKYALAIRNIRATPIDIMSGATHVEWPHPELNAWKTATFQRMLDGETVEVYVETSDDGGSSWSDWSGNPSGGIDQGVDLSGISPNKRIRFRIEFQRSSTSNAPRLDTISRRWVV